MLVCLHVLAGQDQEERPAFLTGGYYMRTVRSLGALVLLAAAAVTSSSPDTPAQTGAQLRPGVPAPQFSLLGSDGKTYSLADFKGKQAVVLAWFVKAYSGG